MAILKRGRGGEIDELRNLKIFSTVDDSELRTVAEIAETVEVPKGTTLTEEDEFHGSAFFVVLDGSAVVTHGNKQVGRIAVGDFFGEMSAIEPRKRSATVTAETDMRLLVFDRFAFDQLIAEVLGATRAIIREMGRRIRELEEQLAKS